MNHKLLKIFKRYENSLAKRLEEVKKAKKDSRNVGGNLFRISSMRVVLIKKGNKTKNKILNFYIVNERWPSRYSNKKNEVRLAQRFENFLAKTSAAYDIQLRRIVLISGRKTNNKRPHDIEGFKQRIVSFIKEYGRAPRRYREATIEDEGNLRAKLEYYTQNLNDKTFLGQVYDLDKCHRSGIPYKYRPLINKSIEVEKPLIRLPIYILNGELL